MAVLFRGRVAVTVPDEVAADYLADGFTTTPGPEETLRDAEEAEPEGEPEGEPATEPRRAARGRTKATP